jgi:hypothetical protein
MLLLSTKYHYQLAIILSFPNPSHVFAKKKLKLVFFDGVFRYTGVPEFVDQTYSVFSLVINENNSVQKNGQSVVVFL